MGEYGRCGGLGKDWGGNFEGFVWASVWASSDKICLVWWMKGWGECGRCGGGGCEVRRGRVGGTEGECECGGIWGRMGLLWISIY